MIHVHRLQGCKSLPVFSLLPASLCSQHREWVPNSDNLPPMSAGALRVLRGSGFPLAPLPPPAFPSP